MLVELVETSETTCGSARRDVRDRRGLGVTPGSPRALWIRSEWPSRGIRWCALVALAWCFRTPRRARGSFVELVETSETTCGSARRDVRDRRGLGVTPGSPRALWIRSEWPSRGIRWCALVALAWCFRTPRRARGSFVELVETSETTGDPGCDDVRGVRGRWGPRVTGFRGSGVVFVGGCCVMVTDPSTGSGIVRRACRDARYHR